jgi:hypothetical protein
MQPAKVFTELRNDVGHVLQSCDGGVTGNNRILKKSWYNVDCQRGRRKTI